MRSRLSSHHVVRALVFLSLVQSALPGYAQQRRLAGLFLGDSGHHRPIERAAELLPALAQKGIDVAYTEDLNDLNSEFLNRFDFLIIYANHTQISPEQEKALIRFVESGHGLVALHCASYCFLNSEAYVQLIGGQFQRHDPIERFPVVVSKQSDAAVRGVNAFTAEDEPYVHHRLTDDRNVLMYREAGGKREPWTWTRSQGKGRVFYTASGHDQRVFRMPEYHDLVAQGIRWAVGQPDYQWEMKTPDRAAAELPNYRHGERGNPGRLHDMPLPLTVEESMRHQSVPGGFEVQLFASEPQIVKPIAFAWDHRGRLWVCESIDYPNNLQPPGQGNDRLKICEDTDGDGKADKFTIFADKLSIPTSLVFANGGVIVAQAPDMLFLQDTDGDDVADVRKTLFTGFNTWDTHAGPSNLRMGIDNWIYATVGYSGFDGSVGGEQHQFRQGIFRFKPDGSKLEFLTSTSNNTWGLGLEETGEILYSTANNEHSSYLAISNRYFERVRGWLERGNERAADHVYMHPIGPIRQVDFFDGFTAAAGHALYTARQFPRNYHNHVAFICEPTGHLVHMCLITNEGSRYVTKDRFNLLASSDEWSAPIAAEVGPDGAVWVIDWYNYIIQHNPIPQGFEKGKGNAYVTELRDKKHGRVYRIINQSQPLSQSFALSKDDPQTLLAGLQSDNMFWRTHAQRLLVERGELDVVAELIKLVDTVVGDADSTAGLTAAHALWTLDGLGAFMASKHTEVLDRALKHSGPAVRKAAVRIVATSTKSADRIVSAGLLSDADPMVRRAALLSLQDCEPSTNAGREIAGLLSEPAVLSDRWLPLACVCGAAPHADGFLEAVSQPAAEVGEEQLRHPRRFEAIEIVARHVARGADPQQLQSLVPNAAHADPAAAEAILAGLAAGWPEGVTIQLGDVENRLVSLVHKLSSAGQLHLATLNKHWQSRSLGNALVELPKRLLATVEDEKLDDAGRLRSARQFMELQPPAELQQQLLSMASARVSPRFAEGILNAAASSKDEQTGQLLVEQWPALTPALRERAVDVLLRRPEWTRALLEALKTGGITIAELGADHSQRLANHPDSAIASSAKEILAKGGRLPNQDRLRVLDEYLSLAAKQGDAAKGRIVFEKTCSKCHKHGEMGTEIGPNLTGFAVHPKEKILTEILDPNRSVEGNFRQYVVSTLDGEIISGLLASETRTALELVDSQAKRHVVLREDIEQLIGSQKSIMPEGLEKELSKEQIVDLLEFLAAKGKYLPVPLDKVATVVTTKGMFHEGDNGPDRLIFSEWSPKTVDGIPFLLIDPRGQQKRNGVLLNGPWGTMPPQMPRSVHVDCNSPASAIHLLSGVSGWGYPAHGAPTVSMTVRLHYSDGKIEDHPLINGRHFADYIRRVDVPESKFAFDLRGQQLRLVTIHPKSHEVIEAVELLKGNDPTAPLVMAMTLETEE